MAEGCASLMAVESPPPLLAGGGVRGMGTMRCGGCAVAAGSDGRAVAVSRRHSGRCGVPMPMHAATARAPPPLSLPLTLTPRTPDPTLRSIAGSLADPGICQPKGDPRNKTPETQQTLSDSEREAKSVSEGWQGLKETEQQQQGRTQLPQRLLRLGGSCAEGDCVATVAPEPRGAGAEPDAGAAEKGCGAAEVAEKGIGR